MSKTMILVAVATLSGGIRDKTDRLVPFEAMPGTELTPQILTKLGLDDDAVEALTLNGAIAQVDVRTAAAADSDDGELAGQLTAETKRADDAEGALKLADARIKELEGKLAAVGKPAAPGAAQ